MLIMYIDSLFFWKSQTPDAKLRAPSTYPIDLCRTHIIIVKICSLLRPYDLKSSGPLRVALRAAHRQSSTGGSISSFSQIKPFPLPP